MLQFIRDKSQGWIAWIIIGSICVIFALWGVSSYLYSAQEVHVVAQVNGVKITEQQLSTVYNQLKRQQELSLGANYASSKASSEILKNAALQSIISNIVLTNAAVSDGFEVAPELVDAAIAKMPIFQVNGAFSEARFQQALNALLYSPNEFFDQVSHNILNNQVQFGIQGSAFALPAEVLQAMALIHQKRTFDYTVLPVKIFLSQVKLQPTAIADYYKAHSDEFKTPEKVSIEYLQLSVANLMKQIRPNEQQIKDFYEDNISSYTTPEEWRVAHILISLPMRASSSDKDKAQKKMDDLVQKIKSGSDFGALAKQYSEDKLTAGNGGVLPWQNGGQFSSEVRMVLPSLKKVGDISTPIFVSGQGYELLKVVGIKPAVVAPFASVREKVFQMYKQQKAEQKFSDLSDQLSNITYESPNSLQPAAKQLGLEIQTTSLFTKQGGADTVTKNPKIIEAAFSDEVVNQHDNSDPVNLNDNSTVILRAKQYIPAAVKPLATVKDSIESTLRLQEAAVLANQKGATILTSLNQGMTLAQLAKKYNIVWQQATNVRRIVKTVNSGVLMQAFQSPVPSKTIARVNSGVSVGNGDFAIVSLTNVTPGDVHSMPASQHLVYSKAAEEGFGALEYQLYSQGLIQKAKIKKFNN